MPHTDMVEKMKTHFMLQNLLQMHFARWITNATVTHSEYRRIVIAFARQQWLRERTSILSFTYMPDLLYVDFS
jgi:hypothetical protein